jgi:hypothetical protein
MDELLIDVWLIGVRVHKTCFVVDCLPWYNSRPLK